MANNTTGGSWWKQAVEWGSDLLDWGSDSVSDSFLSNDSYTTGIGGREISAPRGVPTLGDDRFGGTGGTGWDWWETAKKYRGYVDEYVVDPFKKVMGYGKDIYSALPKSVQDAITGEGGQKRDEDRPRAKAARAKADMSSTTRQIGSSRTARFNPKNLYGRNSPTGQAMYQAAKSEAIRDAMLRSINTGSKTISLNQARDIYTYLSRRG